MAGMLTTALGDAQILIIQTLGQTKDINPIPSSVFAPPVKPAPVVPSIDQGQVNKLLDHVMRGEQDEAEQMIKANPQLLNHKGAGKEFHNGREFKSITPFQYALWALDWYMWVMMIVYMDLSEARSQLEELESRGTEHGKQFDVCLLQVRVHYLLFKF